MIDLLEREIIDWHGGVPGLAQVSEVILAAGQSFSAPRFRRFAGREKQKGPPVSERPVEIEFSKPIKSSAS